jgi:hypothetical protein
MSQALKRLGKRLAARNGIEPLRPGERRPIGYYMGSHTTGKPVYLDANAVVEPEQEAKKAGR